MRGTANVCGPIEVHGFNCFHHLPALDAWEFFNRGLIDAAAALEHLTVEQVVESFGLAYRYNKRVFLAPPWPEIYTSD
jgi:predicted ATPase